MLKPVYSVQVRKLDEFGNPTDLLNFHNIISLSIQKQGDAIARTATIELPNTDYVHLLHSKQLLRPYDLVKIELGYANALSDDGRTFQEQKKTVFAGYIESIDMPFGISGQTLTLNLKSLEGMLTFKRISGSFSGSVADIVRQIIQQENVGMSHLVRTDKFLNPNDPDWYYFDLIDEELKQSDRSGLGIILQNVTFKNERVFDALKQVASRGGFHRVEIIWDDETTSFQLVLRNVDRYQMNEIPKFEISENIISHSLKISVDRMFNVIKLNYKAPKDAKKLNQQSSGMATKGSQVVERNEISIQKYGERTREVDITWPLSKEELQRYAQILLRIYGNLSLDHEFETIGDIRLDIDVGARIILKSKWGVKYGSQGKFDSYIRIDNVTHNLSSQGFRTSVSGKVTSTKTLEEMITFEDVTVI